MHENTIMSTFEDNDPPKVEKKQVQDFFSMGVTAKCSIQDCKSELKHTRPSHLLRHIELKHPSKLVELKELPVSQMNLRMLKESTILLAVRHVTICGRPLTSQKLIDERMQRLRQSKDHNLAINEKTVKAKIGEIVQKMQNQIRKGVEGKFLSFAMDIASRHNRSLIGTSLQFIDGTELVTHTIMMEKILKSVNIKV